MSGIEPSENADFAVFELHDRVIGRLHEAGLRLAGIIGLVALDKYVTENLRGVIDEVETAARDLRNAVVEPSDRGHQAGPGASHRLSIVDPASRPAEPARRARTDERRYLCRFDDGLHFAYATPTGHDFFRAFDHTLWAHESGDVLLSARSGTPLARRVGSVFQDINSDTPLYYERTDERI
jgi:hypothetical protein